MTDEPTDRVAGLPPPRLERLLDRFEALSRDQTMAVLVEFANQFAELPPRFAELTRDERYVVHECMTPVSLFSEMQDGRIYFFADVPKSAPTIRALLAIFTQALNGEPPESVLAIPPDFVSRLMRKVGLMTRERGLNAMIARMKHHAAEALAA
ncbi:MAG: SufE family protein [Gemmatimonadota bacterium]